MNKDWVLEDWINNHSDSLDKDFPNAKNFDEPIPSIIKGDIEKNCAICGKPTFWYDIDFECAICSFGCANKILENWVEKTDESLKIIGAKDV